MRWFLQTLIIPVLGALAPKVIFEIGAAEGFVTGPLLDWADANAAVVHVIEPKPLFDVRVLQMAHPRSLRLHRGRSLRVLPQIECADLVLVDGDHNWYTVINELRQLERRASRAKRLPPLILLHDVEWPYARRDLYYEPKAIPRAFRHPHARSGLVPGEPRLTPAGLNPHLDNAMHEGGAANGVLTAVEDYIAESPLSWRLTVVPGLYGVGILCPTELLAHSQAVKKVVNYAGSARFLRAHCRAVELARISAVIRASEPA